MKATPVILALLAVATHAAEPPTAEETAFFEKHIRPMLVEKCYDCHSAKAEKIKGGLTLDTRDGLRRGGDNGQVVIPGDAEKSALITAIRYQDSDLAMPPKKAGGKLPDAVIRDFEQWVKMGAPDPRTGSAPPIAKKYDTSAAKNWWAFQPPKASAPPTVKDAAWPRGDIDHFVLAALEEKGLSPVGDADKATLLRRVYFDLTGLPPSPDELRAFLTDQSPAAFEKIVDRLLASPRFGEHWGRHWLDVARYAESSGRDVNVTFPNAWRYRDYVVAALNEDKPFDRFAQEQLAGDLLPAADARQRAEQLVATGFLAVGAKSLNETNPRQFAVDLADEQADSVGQAFLGLTVGCARCHDHKFDPVSQRDYTALAGIFLSTDTRFGTPGGVQGRNLSRLVELPAEARVPIVAAPMAAEKFKGKTARMEDLSAQLAKILADRAPNNPNRERNMQGGMNAFDIVRLFTQKAELEAELSNYESDGRPKALTMGVADKPLTATTTRRGPSRGQRTSGFEIIGDSPLFGRGDIAKAGDPVPRGMPALLATAPEIPPDTSGRLQLAQWLTSPGNPLTSRVIVNRAWHWLFGRGLVASTDNFGTTGERPSHPELLDSLAKRFTADGWSLKRLIRQIVLSRTYQLAATHDDARFAADPENALLWRHSPRRLDAESIRDAMLAASGSLDLKPPVSLIAKAGDGPVGGPRNNVITDEQASQAMHNGRSLYLPAARSVPPEALSVFDLPDASAVRGAREVTNVPAQSLFLMNSEFVTQQSGRLAARVLAAYPGDAAAHFDERFAHACWLTLGRAPEAAETAAAKALLARKPATAWPAIARGLFTSAPFRMNR